MKEVEFTLSDGLLLKGSLLDNETSKDLIIMLHSGGYERTEHGVKEINGPEKIYYNPEGNYTYLSNYLAQDASILLFDQRNHGESGKNVDVVAMIKAIKNINSKIDDNVISDIIIALKRKDELTIKRLLLNLNTSQEEQEKLQALIARPIIKDMSFLQMAQDLAEVIEKINENNRYKNIHLVGTCMGALVSALYLINYPNDVKSLTLFSPLYTFDPVFLHPINDFSIKKREVIASGKQYRMGNAVEGEKTIAEIASIKDDFYKKLFKLNIPIFCIQGLSDALVPASYQNALFASLKKYHDQNNLSPIYYAEISPGVHCLYDCLFPSLLEATNFIASNLEYPKLKK